VPRKKPVRPKPPDSDLNEALRDNDLPEERSITIEDSFASPIRVSYNDASVFNCFLHELEGEHPFGVPQDQISDLSRSQSEWFSDVLRLFSEKLPAYVRLAFEDAVDAAYAEAATIRARRGQLPGDTADEVREKMLRRSAAAHKELTGVAAGPGRPAMILEHEAETYVRLVDRLRHVWASAEKKLSFASLSGQDRANVDPRLKDFLESSYKPPQWLVRRSKTHHLNPVSLACLHAFVLLKGFSGNTEPNPSPYFKLNALRNEYYRLRSERRGRNPAVLKPPG
jgi:hypothetical protein